MIKKIIDNKINNFLQKKVRFPNKEVFIIEETNKLSYRTIIRYKYNGLYYLTDVYAMGNTPDIQEYYMYLCYAYCILKNELIDDSILDTDQETPIKVDFELFSNIENLYDELFDNKEEGDRLIKEAKIKYD